MSLLVFCNGIGRFWLVWMRLKVVVMVDFDDFVLVMCVGLSVVRRVCFGFFEMDVLFF